MFDGLPLQGLDRVPSVGFRCCPKGNPHSNEWHLRVCSGVFDTKQRRKVNATHDNGVRPPRWLAPALAALVALTPLAIDTYLPAIPAMAAALGADVAQVQHSVSSYLLGFAIGQLCGGPLSDRWGRVLAGTVGLCIFIASSAAILFVHQVEGLVILRFFQALGGGFATVICGAMVRDLYSGRQAARIMSMIATMILVAPMVAPLIGSWLLALGDWHIIFVFLLLYGVAMLVLVRAALPETVSRWSRARRQRQPRRHLFRSYGEIVRCRRAMGFLLGQAMVSGSLFIYVTTAPFVFMTQFGVSAAKFPLYFGACVLGMVVMVQANIRLLRSHAPRQILLVGMVVQLTAASGQLILVLWLGEQQGVLSWMLMLVPTVASFGLLAPNSAACYLEFFPRIGGSANALYGAALFIFGGLVGGGVNTLLDGSLVPVALGMWVCAALALSAALGLARAHRPIRGEQ